MSKPRNYTIIGAGPSGLVAAHACKMADPDGRIQIYDRRADEPHEAPGVVVLHESIPGVTLAPIKVGMRKIGTREAYAENVYGRPDAPCSWDRWEEDDRVMYDVHELREKLMDRYREPCVRLADVAPADVAHLTASSDLLVLAAPAKALCAHPEYHAGKTAVTHVRHVLFEGGGAIGEDWDDLMDYAHELVHRVLGDRHTDPAAPESVIIYVGDRSSPLRRVSYINDVMTIESAEPFSGSVEGYKPISRACYCPESAAFAATGNYLRFVRAGRFAEHRSGILLHEVFADVFKRAAKLATTNQESK